MDRNAMTMESVLEKSDQSRPLIVVDNQVVDLTEFLRWHPGGLAVLLANLGRDASEDYHHVSAHERAGVRQKLQKLVVADVDSAELPAAWAPLGDLLDYVRLVRNSFAIQLGTEQSPFDDLVYVGQSYCHLLDDHVRAFLDGFCALAGRTTDQELVLRLGDLSVDTKGHIENLVTKAEGAGASSFARWLQSHCVLLLEDLLACGSAAMRTLRTSCAETVHCVEQAISVIENWIDKTEGTRLVDD